VIITSGNVKSRKHSSESSQDIKGYHMFNLSLSSAIGIAARTLIIYVVILAGLRLSGKREVGQMTVFDLVVLLLISNAVQNAMVGPDTSLVGGIVAAVALLLVNAALAKLSLSWPRLRHVVEGTPTLLVLHGDIIAEHMRKEGIDEETLLAALREHGVDKIAEVEMAVLEIDGSISVVPPGGITTHVKKPLKFLRHQ
jgi:uncharacterized membrane protein YcaP (DUF421 family)